MVVSSNNPPNAQEFMNNFSSQTVDVLVGKSRKTTFKVSKNLLCNVSKYFQECLTGSTTEASEQKIELQESPQLFPLFFHWLHTSSSAFERCELGGLVPLWEWGNKYKIPTLCKDINKTLIDKCAKDASKIYNISLIKQVYDNKIDCRPLHNLVLEIAQRAVVVHGKYLSTPSGFPEQFHIDLTTAVNKLQESVTRKVIVCHVEHGYIKPGGGLNRPHYEDSYYDVDMYDYDSDLDDDGIRSGAALLPSYIRSGHVHDPIKCGKKQMAIKFLRPDHRLCMPWN